MATSDARQRLEGLYTAHRILELRLEPVRGQFDAEHLKEINRRIFQDMPGLGFTDVTPGRYRPPVPAGNDWVKRRKLETITPIISVAYSSMDKAAQDRLDGLLKDAHPVSLATLDKEAFTRQLAQACGYTIDWGRFSKLAAGRDLLYIARDLSVNALALPHVRHLGTRRDILYSMDILAGNRPLPDLLRDAVRPIRAVAFEKIGEKEALQAHPELKDAYKTLHAAAHYFETKMPGDVHAQRQALAHVRQHVQTRLDQGETRNFRQSDPTREQRQQEQSARTVQRSRQHG